MAKKNYKVIGVMSGTSLDGIDLAFVEFEITAAARDRDSPSYSSRIHIAETIPYTDHWQQKLSAAHTYTKQQLYFLNKEYTQLLGNCIAGFIEKHQLDHLDAVCSHGHTVIHQPDKGITLQIGNLPELARQIGIRLVCDFRVQDVALGGQGAPLVPIGDHLLFGGFDYCINLGGFANISMVENGQRVAYDICPVNVVLNRYAQLLGEAYDDKGAFAKAGTVSIPLVKQLNALPYYQMTTPKSLGIEWVHKHILPLLERSGLAPGDVLATFTAHVAEQIAIQCDEGSTVLLTGGGAYNAYLIDRIRAHKKLHLEVPSDTLVSFKEALLFGFLGVLRLEDQVNCLSSVTGAERDHCSGAVFLP